MENQKKKKKPWYRHFRIWLHQTVALYSDSDEEMTIRKITNGVEFRGSNVWILIFAIVIASVGLNINSTAVIIGAMLISPLMGPIMGIGLALGINDFSLFRRSLRNFILMVGISIITSTIFFFLSPLSDAQSELLARTMPTFYDVCIAIFGGMAGIVASSRKDEKITVVSGVAIATALMPPLCTAGYGIATGNLHYFSGAFYLFFINSFFIALATFLIVKYLRFKPKSFVDKKTEKAVKRYIFVFVIIVTTPSVFFAINVVKKTSFDNNVAKYMDYVKKELELNDTYLIDYKINYSSDSSTIKLTLLGNSVSKQHLNFYQEAMKEYDLKKTSLHIIQASGSLNPDNQTQMLKNIFESNEKEIEEKNKEIIILKDKVKSLEGYNVGDQQIAKEININFPDVLSFSINKMVYFDTKKSVNDTIPTLYVEFKGKPSDQEMKRLAEWLKVRYNFKKIRIIVPGSKPVTYN